MWPSQEENTNGAKSQVSANPGEKLTQTHFDFAAPGAALCCFTHAFPTGAAFLLIQSELHGPTL